jgi:predicted DNA-binding transcriptional regulator YafY
VAGVAGEPRTYRVGRIQSAETLDEPCVRPAGFDLAEYWEQSTARFQANLPRYPATVRVHPDSLAYLRAIGRYARIEREYPPESDGWVPLAMVFEGEHNACEYVLSFGARIEVVEPEALRELVICAAQSILTLYARRSPVEEHIPGDPVGA